MKTFIFFSWVLLIVANAVPAQAAPPRKIHFNGHAFQADLQIRSTHTSGVFQEVSFIGQFAMRDRAELKNLIDHLEPQVPIRISILSSMGGYRKVVDELVHGIRSKCKIENGCEIQTAIQGICYSACTYFFLAGHRRWVGKNAEIGLHRKWAVSPFVPVQSKQSMVDEYRALGANGAWWDQHPETLAWKKQTSLTLLNPQAALDSRFATDYHDDFLAPWALER